MSRKLIAAFVHIEKTAGTSVIHMLRNNYSPRYVDVRPVIYGEYWFGAKDLAWYLRYFPMIRIIGGHSVVPFSGLEDYCYVDYFTVLRDPVDRYISQYRYWRSSLGKDISFEVFLERVHTFNLQTKKIHSTRQASQAIPVLEKKFCAIGIVENINPFVSALSTYFNQQLTMFSRNQTRNTRDRADEIKDHYLQKILDRNEQDMLLYQWAKKHQMYAPISPHRKDHSIRSYFDYVFRKGLVQPLTGLKRKSVGLPYSGLHGIESNG